MVNNSVGKKVMVLRPVRQSDELCRLLVDSGSEVIRFPSLEIVPIKKITVDEINGLVNKAEVIIFISRNSVNILSDMIGSLHNVFKDKLVFAAGNGTADEARLLGVEQIISPGDQSGSDSLLKLTNLQSDAILGKNILIIRGDTGREILKQELESRGASVKYAEIYSRIIPEVSQEYLQEIWQKNPPDLIVVTSEQGLINLINMTPLKYHGQLFSTDIVTMSERIAKAAIDKGFKNKTAIAEAQTDQGLHDAVIKHLE